MKTRFLIPLLVGGLFTAAPVAAQSQDTPDAENGEATDTETRNPFWQVSVGGGHYMVRLDRIASISRHRYLLDGAVVVDEVTVDTSGQALARFYHLAPLADEIGDSSAGRIAQRGRQIIEDAAGRAGTDAHRMVVKKYPDTTHARSIEYRVDSAEQLTTIYDSLRAALERGRGREVVVPR